MMKQKSAGLGILVRLIQNTSNAELRTPDHRPVFKVRKPGKHRKIQRANGGRQAAKKSVFSISQDTLYTSPLTFGVKKAVIIISGYTFQVHFQKMHVMGQKV